MHSLMICFFAHSLPGRRQKLDFTKLNELMKAIGQGSCLIVVQRVSLLVTALPSLTLMYYVSFLRT